MTRAELDQVLAAASTVGGGSDVLNSQLEFLQHQDSAVRWWGVFGLRQQSGEAADSGLRSAISDSSSTVRIEVAAALASRGIDVERARDVLQDEIAGDDPRLAHRAARAAQLLRFNDDKMVQVVQHAAKRHATEWLREISRALVRQRSGEE